jgi:phenylpyruvate tautomerase PptA (4-oxalocrotonate tautomerase family)
MPFIDSKVTVKMSEEKKEQVKSRLGQAVSIIGKPESYLMVGFEDEYELYFAGQRVDRGAFVSVQIFGGVRSDQSNKLTGEISKILSEELDIPADKIYIAYQGTENWGFNGRNF